MKQIVQVSAAELSPRSVSHPLCVFSQRNTREEVRHHHPVSRGARKLQSESILGSLFCLCDKCLSFISHLTKTTLRFFSDGTYLQ